MNKKKAIIVTAAVITGVLVASFVIFILWWHGAFNKFAIKNVASFDSPDGSYCLKYQQLGEPEWPFGKTDVRLALYDTDGKKINAVDTFVQDDGAIASVDNIKTVEWAEASVTVVLQASEMEDKVIEITYKS